MKESIDSHTSRQTWGQRVGGGGGGGGYAGEYGEDYVACVVDTNAVFLRFFSVCVLMWS